MVDDGYDRCTLRTCCKIDGAVRTARGSKEAESERSRDEVKEKERKDAARTNEPDEDGVVKSGDDQVNPDLLEGVQA